MGANYPPQYVADWERDKVPTLGGGGGGGGGEDTHARACRERPERKYNRWDDDYSESLDAVSGLAVICVGFKVWGYKADGMKCSRGCRVL